MIIFEGGAANLQLSIETYFYASVEAEVKLRGIVASDVIVKRLERVSLFYGIYS